jgi:hypothetical protein
VSDVDKEMLGNAAEVLGMPCDLQTAEATAATGGEILRIYALRASMYIVDKAIAYVCEQGKKLLILLSYNRRRFLDLVGGKRRFDLPFLEYLDGTGLPYVDVLPKHMQDYQQFRCTPEEYARRYWIGHYGPTGNHFFAFAVKGALVDWLDPKPPAYWAVHTTVPADRPGARQIKESSEW